MADPAKVCGNCLTQQREVRRLEVDNICLRAELACERLDKAGDMDIAEGAFGAGYTAGNDDACPADATTLPLGKQLAWNCYHASLTSKEDDRG